MTSIERKLDVYNMSNEKNCINSKTTSFINVESKLIHGKDSTVCKESEFENEIKKIFQQKKFLINNQYDHHGVKNFLKEKDECLKKMELDDSILYINLNVHKKIENKKNQCKNHKNLKSVNNKEKTEIKNLNQKVIDSFISNESRESIEEILKLLK